jgi:hypothetical protein
MKIQSQLQLITILITATISSVFLAYPTQAQVPVTSTPQPVIECLGIPEAEAGGWQNIQGQDIWLGYPTTGETPQWGTQHGFAWPSDVQSHQLTTLSTSVGERYVLVVSSQTTPDTYYVLPFISMEPYADANGNYYGAHPCGAFSVTYDQLQAQNSQNGNLLETLQNFDTFFRGVTMQEQDANIVDTLLSSLG